MKDELFYFPNGNILCYVYGYYSHLRATVFAKVLQDNAENLANLAGKTPEDIIYFEINQSRRYKGMIAFMVETTAIPTTAYVVGNDYWTVLKWLQD